MFVINYQIYTKERFVYNMPEENYTDREEARARYIELKNNEFVVNLRGEERGKTRRVVEVVYCTGGKEYTFETDMKVKPNDLAVVIGDEGPTLVKVISAPREELETEIEKRFPLSRLKKLAGKVQMAH